MPFSKLELRDVQGKHFFEKHLQKRYKMLIDRGVQIIFFIKQYISTYGSNRSYTFSPPHFSYMLHTVQAEEKKISILH